MTKYKVRCEWEVEADSPQEAARFLQFDFDDGEVEAGVYEVWPAHDTSLTVMVDLSEEIEEDSNKWREKYIARLCSTGKFVLQFGIQQMELSAIGQTIQQLRDEYGVKFRISEKAKPYMGVTVLEPDYIVRPGDMIEFYVKMSEKGMI